MSTKITADNGAEIQVGQLGITVDHPEGIASIWARLSHEQRSALADALAPGRQGWTLADLARLRTTLANPTAAGGPWTRDDLPSLPDVLGEITTHDRGEGAAAYRMAALTHLNAHHPKPELSAMDYAEIVALEAARATRAERQRDDAHTAYEKAASERDAAVARAEAAARVLRERDEQEDDATRAACERAEEAEARATLAEQERENWRITAINRAAPAVSRADIEKAISELRTFPRFLTDELLVLRDEAIDAAWALVSGNEAEQSTDPVEEKARELYRAATPDARWETVSDEYRRIAAHVIGQEATR